MPETAIPEYVIDGRRTTTVDEFYAEVGRALLGTAEWGGGSEEDLHVLLRGGAGGEPARFRLVWRHVGAARASLGHAEAARGLTRRLRDCPPNVLIKTAWALRAALRGAGPTAFEALEALVREHPNVALVLAHGAGSPRPQAAP